MLRSLLASDSVERAFTITINDVNESPTALALSAASVDETMAASSRASFQDRPAGPRSNWVKVPRMNLAPASCGARSTWAAARAAR